MALTPKQQAFVDAYDGNGTAAARAAGYKGTDNALGVQAHALLRNPKVLAAIQARTNLAPSLRADVTQAAHIATRAERQAFWTQVMFDQSKKMTDRLKAAELLGKSEADFVDRLQHEGKLTLEQLVLASQKPEGT